MPTPATPKPSEPSQHPGSQGDRISRPTRREQTGTRFSDVVRKSWEEHLLFSVLLELTYRCNLNCYFCYNDLGATGRALSLDDYERLLDDLAKLQVFQLVLTGGEPMAHPDFFAIGRKARDLGFVVRLKSNAHGLNPEMARRLRAEVDPFIVEVSLHGADAATHERQTRVPGSFDRLLTNLAAARDLGLRLKLQTTLTRWNEDQIEDILGLAQNMGLAIHVDPVVTPRDGGDTSPLSVSPSPQGVERLLRLQRQLSPAPSSEAPSPDTPAPDAKPQTAITVGRDADQWMPKGSPKKHCGAGSGGLAIDPYGQVYPCVQWRRPVGNVHESSILDIWSGSSALDDVRAKNEEAKNAVAGWGDWGRALNFCPGTAEVATGDPLGVYDGARLRADLAQSISQAPAQSAASNGSTKKDLLPIIG